uniref:tRNA(Ile)-lysidine synthase n=1 Tax=Chroothece richteriana TaxID=101928 RepID=UPI001FCD6C63|nr:tRNA(Ile)-lysidine synthase [Chroothece richteriana]UNJ14236.1 tRNA(Ile)-lysidine synthase [Chroothece richteriana]
MITYLHHRVTQTLFSLGFLRSNLAFLIAVSGGKDSLALLQIIYEISPLYKWRVGVIHCDHRWREDSKLNTYSVYDFTQELKIPFYLGGNEHQLQTEEESRLWRYSMFFSIADQYNYNIILTAHNLNDRVETLFYNLFRGTGVTGLSSLALSKKINENLFLVRPLLTVSQFEIAWFCRHFSLPVWSDSTNFNSTYSRNRIRQDLIPYLKHFFNPRVEEHITSFLDKVNLQNTYFNKYVDLYFSRTVHSQYLALHTTLFKNLHPLMQNLILMHFLQYLNLSAQMEKLLPSVKKVICLTQYDNTTLKFGRIFMVKKRYYFYICEQLQQNN